MDSPSFFRLDGDLRRTVPAVLAVVVVYLMPLAGAPPATNPNELVRLELAVAMAELGAVELDGPARVYGLSEDVARHRNRVLADKAPGLSLAAVPVLWIAGGLLPTVPGTSLPAYWPLRHLTTALLVALATVAAVALLVRRVATSRGVDWPPLLILAALATPLLTYGTVFFGHGAAAALIAVAWALLIGPGADGPPRGLGAVVGGLAAGFAISTEYPTVMLVAVMLITVAVRRTPPRAMLLIGAGLAGGLLPGAIYHQIAFGAPWLTGYAFKADAGFADIHATGLGGVSWPTAAALWGVLGSSARGLFFYSPLLLMAPFGLVAMYRRGRWRQVAPVTAAAAAYIAFAAGFVDWTAGWCAAARHLVPVIPVLLVPTLVAAVAAGRRRWTAVAFAALAAVSVVRTLLTVVLTPFFPPEFDRPLSQLVVPSLIDGAAAPTLLGAVLGVPAPAVWVAVAVGLAAAGAWAVTRLAPGAFRWAVGAWLAVIVLQLAWLAVGAGRLEPRLEGYRMRVLAGLGHPITAPSPPGGPDAAGSPVSDPD